MLDLNEMTNLEEAKRNIQDKAVILNAAIDIQALLRLLVEKEVIGKEEINSQRQEVRESFKYRNAITYIEQTMKEIEFYEKNPDARLREMFRRKMEGKRTPQEKIKLTQLGLKPGVSDLLLPFPRGHYGNLYIEMKFGPGTLQPEQKEFLKAMTAAGHYTCVCYTARDATETIETYLNLKWDEEMPNPPYGILKEGEWKCITEREQKRKERNAVH